MTIVEANNIQINYELNENGNEETIVFIHGLSDSLNYWRVLSSNLDYRCLSFDLRGHGLSAMDEREVTIDLYTEDLYSLLKRLNIEEAVFVGLSLGGNIAMNFALRHPDMVRGIIVMSSFSRFNPHLRKIFNDFYESVEDGFESFFDTILPYTLPDDMLSENRETLDFLKKELAPLSNVEGIKAGIKAGYMFNITDELNAIRVPSLVIAGEDDDLTDMDIQKEICENIGDCDMVVFENTKHNILIGKNIEAVLGVIEEFMYKVSD
ncbi:MAG: alpha/beta hydrolase [Methanobrevibacter sp.]|nr:alpha/beta hydrolase [Methanobrevibacter sp.]